MKNSSKKCWGSFGHESGEMFGREWIPCGSALAHAQRSGIQLSPLSNPPSAPAFFHIQKKFASMPKIIVIFGHGANIFLYMPKLLFFS